MVSVLRFRDRDMKRKDAGMGGDGRACEEEVCPAFVTDPVSMMYGQQEIQRAMEEVYEPYSLFKTKSNHGADPRTLS